MIDSAGTIHLLALMTTLIVEALGMVLWARFAYLFWQRALVCVLAINLVVHTLFWYSQPLFTSNWPWGLYVAEVIVVLVEGVVYARFLTLSGITPWLLSLFLNTASFLIGLWLWQLLM